MLPVRRYGPWPVWLSARRPHGAPSSDRRRSIGSLHGPDRDHHRLLFGMEGDRLEVVELVARSALDVTLKRLRAT
jgi:hypothetical protein